MTTNQQAQALSNTDSKPAAASKTARTIHVHTCMTAVECFDDAVQKNMDNGRVTESAAVRKALPWGNGTLLKQIKDDEEAKKFVDFLNRERGEHGKLPRAEKPLHAERPSGPKMTTATEVKNWLEASPQPFKMAADLYRHIDRWDSEEIQKIENMIADVLNTAKRKEYFQRGVVLTAETIDQASEEVKIFIGRVKRFSQPKPSSNARRPRGNSSGYRAPSNVANGDNADRKHDGPKVTVKPTDLESQAVGLKETVARMEANLQATTYADTVEAQESKLQAINAIKAKKLELANVRAQITAEQQARADAKKKARIAHAEASSAASRTIPTVYKTKEKAGAKSETQKGKKQR